MNTLIFASIIFLFVYLAYVIAMYYNNGYVRFKHITILSSCVCVELVVLFFKTFFN